LSERRSYKPLHKVDEDAWIARWLARREGTRGVSQLVWVHRLRSAHVGHAEAFAEAARRAARISDERVARTVSVGRGSSSAYVVSELTPSERLADVVGWAAAAGEAPPPVIAAAIISRAAAGAQSVADLEGGPGAHGAIDADQVEVGYTGSVKLAGVGPAWALAAVPGSPPRGGAAEDARALGGLLYGLLAARRPAESPTQLASIFPGVPVELAKIVDGAVGGAFTAAGALAAALDAWIATVPVPADAKAIAGYLQGLQPERLDAWRQVARTLAAEDVGTEVVAEVARLWAARPPPAPTAPATPATEQGGLVEQAATPTLDRSAQAAPPEVPPVIRVQVMRGEHVLREVSVPATLAHIGSARDAHFRVAGDPEVKPAHAVLYLQGDRIVVASAGGRLAVNDEWVDTATVGPRDIVRIGHMAFRASLPTGRPLDADGPPGGAIAAPPIPTPLPAPTVSRREPESADTGPEWSEATKVTGPPDPDLLARTRAPTPIGTRRAGALSLSPEARPARPAEPRTLVEGAGEAGAGGSDTPPPEKAPPDVGGVEPPEAAALERLAAGESDVHALRSEAPDEADEATRPAPVPVRTLFELASAEAEAEAAATSAERAATTSTLGEDPEPVSPAASAFEDFGGGPPPDGFEPSIWDAEDDEPGDAPLVPVPIGSILANSASGGVSTDTHAPAVAEVVRARAGAVVESALLHPGERHRLGRMRATFFEANLPPGTAGTIHTASGPEPLDGQTTRLGIGERLEFEHEGAQVRVLVGRETPQTRIQRRGAPRASLYALCVAAALALHGAFFGAVLYLDAAGLTVVVERPEEIEVFADVRAPKKPRPKKVRKPKPRPKPKPKPRARPKPADPSDARPKLPEKVQAKLERRLKRRRSEPPRTQAAAAQELLNVLKSPVEGEGQKLEDVVSNLDAVAGKATRSGLNIPGTVAELPGGEVNVARGGGGELGTLSGKEVARTGAGKLKKKAKTGTVRGKVGSVRALAKVRGSIPRSAVLAEINRHQGKVQYCYEKQLTRNADLSGKITLEWTIGTDGRVKSVRQVVSSVQDPEVARCIMGQVRKMRFPKPTGGEVVVRFPWLLSPL
jgi:hypothetical protein